MDRKQDFRAWLVPAEGENEKSVTVRIAFASKMAEAKYKAESTVQLPIYVDVYNQSSDTYGKTIVTIPVNIKN